MCRLSSGDLSFIGNGPDGPLMVGIELKSVHDMLASIQSGRFQDTQLGAVSGGSGSMLEDYQERWLLIYGRYRPNFNNGMLQIFKCYHRDFIRSDVWPYNAVCLECRTVLDNETQLKAIDNKIKRKQSQFYDCSGFNGSRPIPYGYLESFLSSPSLSRLGFLVKRVETIEEAAHWCGVLYRSWTKKWHEHKSMRTIDRSSSSLVPANSGMDDRMRQRLDFAMAFRGCGLGYERSLAVAKHFKSVSEMINASEEEWASISVKSESGRVVKLGPVLAKSVKGAIR